MAEIRLSGVNKVYPGGTHAVHDVDLHIADGEFMIMVGPSGCAKSTILRMIAGLEVPTGGTVEIGGRVVNDVAPKDRDIAMVFQSYALYPHMTVRENMAFGLRLRKMPPTEIDQRVADAARILGLESLLDRLPKAMSGGQRQRVAMGRAIVREPQAFLMDEPLSNLDAKLRVQMRTEIAKLHQRLETTTVYVTHDQVEAMTLGQRICILRKGVVQQVDTPFQVYQNPSNVFVGGFMGSPGMNFMNGHLVLHDGVLHLQLGDQHLPVPASVSSRLLATTDLHGRGVIVGIRPEHLAMSTAGDRNALPVHVELTEAMGAEVYAYFTANVATPDLSALSDTQASSATFVARLGAGTDTRGGEQIMLRPDLEEVHLFDAQSLLTLLAPANEIDVRARQGGAAIQLASGTANAAPTTVAAPQSMIVQSAQPFAPMQPVIHLHQTIVQPEQPTYGTLPEPASPAAIASVFDQPLASPIHVEPLVVGAPRVDVAAHGGTGNPHTAPAPVGPAASSPFASRAASSSERQAFPARPAASHVPPATSGPYASLAGGDAAGPAAPQRVAADAAPIGQVDVLASEPVAEVTAPTPEPAPEAAPAPAPARRGFAPRIIGAPTQDAPSTPTADAVDATQPPATVTIDADDLDAAIDALDAAGANGVDEDAVIGGDGLAIGDPVTSPLARVDLPPVSVGAPSAFRDALARVRAQHAGTFEAPRFGATASASIVPPPLTLAPDDAPGSEPSPATPPGPMVVQPPTISGIAPRVPPSESAHN